MTWQSYQINPRKHPFCRIIFKNGAIFNEQYDKGVAEGEAKGKAEDAKEAMLKTAKAMKVKGFTANDIADITGLTLQVIAKL